ncbi:transposase, partial [Salmonella enterica subsp. enterica serovar Pullorum str. 13036]
RQRFRLVCDNVVREAFSDAKQRYGAPRLTDELRAQGYQFNVKTVAASLRRQGRRAKASRRFRPVSYRKHDLPVSENWLKQDFYTSGPNQKWVGDITTRTGICKCDRRIHTQRDHFWLTGKTITEPPALASIRFN